MKFLKYLSFLFCCFVFTNVQAQSNETIDVIYLKDGSIFRGKIVEYTPGDKLLLQINEDTKINLQAHRIRKIIQKEVGAKGKSRKDYAFRERGFYNLTTLNLAAGTQAWNNDMIVDAGIHNVTGYRFNRFIGVGLGVGMDYYYIGSGENIMPIYAEARGYLKAKNVSPMYSFAAGYGIAFDSDDHNIIDTKGGFMFYPAVGFRLGGSDNANFILDFGVKVQQAEFEFDFGWERQRQRMTYNRFILRTGLMF